jgi:hypothetical protein
MRLLTTHILLVCILAFVTACATPYQPKGFTGGYSQVQLDNTSVRVEFKGNGYTSRERVEAFVLYRCAELTIERGYDYFVLYRGDTESQQQTVQTAPGTFNATTTGSGSHYSTSGTYTPGQTVTFNRRTATAVIKMFKGEKPTDQPGAYVARDLVDNLQSQYSDLKR